MNRLIGVVVGAMLAVILVQPAAAALPTPASGTVWNQNQRVEYRWRGGDEPPGWAKSAMNAAAADSNASRKAKAAVFAYDATGPAWLAYTDDLPTNWAIGYTVRNIPDSFTLKIRPQGTQLDWGTLKWCQFYDDAPNGCYDIEMVTLHEFGHAQTLNHVDEADINSYTDSVMHTTGLHSKAKSGWNQHVFGRCDVARLQIRYEPLTASTPISTCLDLPTDMTISPGSGSVGYASAVTLVAKLKIGADAVYPKLASEPLSERTVILQKRPIGGSWANVGEMSAVTDSTGRYVRTITMTATFEWRAVFSAPNDEGLEATNSNVSRLTVSSGGCSSVGKLTNGPYVETC